MLSLFQKLALVVLVFAFCAMANKELADKVCKELGCTKVYKDNAQVEQQAKATPATTEEEQGDRRSSRKSRIPWTGRGVMPRANAIDEATTSIEKKRHQEADAAPSAQPKFAMANHESASSKSALEKFDEAATEVSSEEEAPKIETADIGSIRPPASTPSVSDGEKAETLNAIKRSIDEKQHGRNRMEATNTLESRTETLREIERIKSGKEESPAADRSGITAEEAVRSMEKDEKTMTEKLSMQNEQIGDGLNQPSSRVADVSEMKQMMFDYKNRLIKPTIKELVQPRARQFDQLYASRSHHRDVYPIWSEEKTTRTLPTLDISLSVHDLRLTGDSKEVVEREARLERDTVYLESCTPFFASGELQVVEDTKSDWDPAVSEAQKDQVYKCWNNYCQVKGREQNIDSSCTRFRQHPAARQCLGLGIKCQCQEEGNLTVYVKSTFAIKWRHTLSKSALARLDFKMCLSEMISAVYSRTNDATLNVEVVEGGAKPLPDYFKRTYAVELKVDVGRHSHMFKNMFDNYPEVFAPQWYEQVERVSQEYELSERANNRDLLSVTANSEERFNAMTHMQEILKDEGLRGAFSEIVKNHQEYQSMLQQMRSKEGSHSSEDKLRFEITSTVRLDVVNILKRILVGIEHATATYRAKYGDNIAVISTMLWLVKYHLEKLSIRHYVKDIKEHYSLLRRFEQLRQEIQFGQAPESARALRVRADICRHASTIASYKMEQAQFAGVEVKSEFEAATEGEREGTSYDWKDEFGHKPRGESVKNEWQHNHGNKESATYVQYDQKWGRTRATKTRRSCRAMTEMSAGIYGEEVDDAACGVCLNEAIDALNEQHVSYYGDVAGGVTAAYQVVEDVITRIRATETTLKKLVAIRTREFLESINDRLGVSGYDQKLIENVWVDAHRIDLGDMLYSPGPIYVGAIVQVPSPQVVIDMLDAVFITGTEYKLPDCFIVVIGFFRDLGARECVISLGSFWHDRVCNGAAKSDMVIGGETGALDYHLSQQRSVNQFLQEKGLLSPNKEDYDWVYFPATKNRFVLDCAVAGDGEGEALKFLNEAKDVAGDFSLLGNVGDNSATGASLAEDIKNLGTFMLGKLFTTSGDDEQLATTMAMAPRVNTWISGVGGLTCQDMGLWINEFLVDSLETSHYDYAVSAEITFPTITAAVVNEVFMASDKRNKFEHTVFNALKNGIFDNIFVLHAGKDETNLITDPDFMANYANVHLGAAELKNTLPSNSMLVEIPRLRTNAYIQDIASHGLAIKMLPLVDRHTEIENQVAANIGDQIPELTSSGDVSVRLHIQPLAIDHHGPGPQVLTAAGSVKESFASSGVSMITGLVVMLASLLFVM